jgi:uncharacterized protein YkwD
LVKTYNGKIKIMEILGFIALIGVIVMVWYKTTKKKKVEEIEYPIYNVSYSELEEEMLKEVNLYRKSLDLPPVVLNGTLSYKAEEHVLYCISQGKISHDNASYRLSWLKNNLPVSRLSEIVAYGYRSPSSVLGGFKRSPDHNSTLIGDYTHVGVSVKKDKNTKMYVTLIFGKIQ